MLAICATSSAQAEGTRDPNDLPAQFHEPSQTERDRETKLFDQAIKTWRAYPARADDLLHQIMAIEETSWGPNHPYTHGKYALLSWQAFGNRWFDASEELARRGIEISEKTTGLRSVDTAAAISSLAELMKENDQPEQAEVLYKIALKIQFSISDKSNIIATDLNDLGTVIAAQGRVQEAQSYFDQSVAMRISLTGKNSVMTAFGMLGQAQNLYDLQKYNTAEEILNSAAAIPQTDKSYNIAKIYTKIFTLLGRTQIALGKISSAEESLNKTLPMLTSEETERRIYRADALLVLGNIERKLRKYTKSIEHLHTGCEIYTIYNDNQLGQKLLSQCARETVLTLYGLSTTGGNNSSLKSEAFNQAQSAEQFESGYALAKYGARVEATIRGVETQAMEYDTAQRRYDSARANYTNSFVDLVSANQRTVLRHKVDAALSDMNHLHETISQKSPYYWDLREPDIVSISSLQARSGIEARLLKEDEVLVVFVLPPGDDHGIVFAISKERSEWAETELSGSQISKMVQQLRTQIDSGSYGAGTSASSKSIFDRQTAYLLFKGLFGNSKITAIIRSKPNLLIVPSGPLASFPPGLLVTSPPVGGPDMDRDPNSLRATSWLLREKSITVLPAVYSLRTLRLLLPRRQIYSAPADRLVAFADPDFAGQSYGYPPPPSMQISETRGISKYFKGSQPISDQLRYLSPLPRTADEAEAIRRQLGAPQDNIFKGRAASETQLRLLQMNGRLTRAQVIEFATHGLIAGDIDGVEQPALALAAPSPQADPALDDGYLTATEAARLNLNADWVILSACNSAAPSSPNAQGLSGLSQSFFNAGARSLLISHWRVSEEVAPILIPDILARLADGRAKTKAEAVQQSELSILDDKNHPDFSSPYFWGPFVLVGEALK